MTNSGWQMTNGNAITADGKSAGEGAFWGDPADEFLAVEEAAVQIYDLEERTAKFGEQIILFAKKVPWDPVNNRLIDQLVGAGTSVGANYCEADDGVSRADFKHRIGICRKDPRETKVFLRMVSTADANLKPEARELWKDDHSLHRIFSRIWRSTKL
jgi:four helix bundle protein